MFKKTQKFSLAAKLGTENTEKLRNQILKQLCFKHPHVTKLAFIADRYQRHKKDLEIPHYIPSKLLLKQNIIWNKGMPSKE